ncbi:MAG: hypothetical protein MHPSP_000106, partial [Paramarteilia canceri]
FSLCAAPGSGERSRMPVNLESLLDQIENLKILELDQSYISRAVSRIALEANDEYFFDQEFILRVVNNTTVNKNKLYEMQLGQMTHFRDLASGIERDLDGLLLMRKESYEKILTRVEQEKKIIQEKMNETKKLTQESKKNKPTLINFRK